MLNIWVVVHDKATSGLNSISQKLKGIDRDAQNAAKGMSAHENATKKNTGATAGFAASLENLERRTRKATAAVDGNTNSVNKNARAHAALSKATRELGASISGLVPNIGRMGTIIVAVAAGLAQLAGLLVQVGAVAGVAAAALGGALVSGMSQALPVIGLLIGAFKQLHDVIKLSSEQQALHIAQLKNASAESLRHEQQLWAEREAHIAVADAQKALIVARRDAVRQIQDLNTAEKEAILTSQRATLGLIGSRDALAGLVAGGGSALDIASAQLDVTSAKQGISQSKIGVSRTAEDAARARRLGIQGNLQVIAANRNLINSQHTLIEQQLEFAQANKDAAATATDLARRIGLLTGAERRLLDAVTNLRSEMKKEWKTVTDPIINSFTDVINKITATLKDPAIKNAFKGLSASIGQAVNTTTSYFFSPQGKAVFLDVMQQARINLPIIAKILHDIEVAWGNIAVAAGPFVHDILVRIGKFFHDFAASTGDRKGMAEFFRNGEAAARALWGVVTGIWDVLSTLGSLGGFTTGVALVKQLGDYLHNVSKELRGDSSGVHTYFDKVKTTVQDLGTALNHVLIWLVRIGNTGALDTIIKVFDKILLPIIGTVLVKLGQLINWLGKIALKNPDVTTTALAIAGIGFAAVKVIGVLKSMVDFLKAARLAWIAMTGAEEAAAIGLLPFSLTIGAIILAIAALAVGVYLLDKKFHFLGPTLAWLKKIFFDVIHYIEENWKGLGRILLLISGPVGWVTLLIIENFGKIVRAAKWVGDKIASLAKWIQGTAVGGAIIQVFKDILSAANDIVHFFDNNSFTSILTSAFNAVLSVVNDFVSALQTAYGVLKDIATLGGLLGGGHPSNPNTAGAGRYTTPGNRSAGLKAGQKAGTVVQTSSPVLNVAQRAIGVDYKYGGSDLNSGVDCSGLVYAAAAKVGIKIPRRSQEQAKLGIEVGSISDLLPGDLLFYNIPGEGPNSHEAIYAGNGNMLVAAHTGTQVTVEPLVTANLSAMRRVRGFQTGLSTGTSSLPSSAPHSGGTQGVHTNADPSRTAGTRSAVSDIISVAQRAGIDPAIFLATALTESGARYGAVGDKGTSFGPFQFHKGGALGNHNEAWANSQAALVNRALEFKRLGITTGAGAATLQGPKDKAAYAKAVNANLARANALILAGGGYLPDSATTPGLDPVTGLPKTKTKARGPGSRGGEAINPAIVKLMDELSLLPDFATLKISDVIRQAKTAFTDKSKRGGNLLVSVFDQLGGIFDEMSRRFNNLVASQKHRLISRRYRVSGASGNTTVQDTGSDLQDANQRLTDLGIDRDSLLAQSIAGDDAIREVKRELSKTKNPARRQKLTGILNGLIAKQGDFQAALDQNTIDIVEAQKAQLQAFVDRITHVGDQIVNSADTQIAIAKLTGVGKGSIPGLIEAKIKALTDEKGPLQAALQASLAAGDQPGSGGLTDTITKILQGIDESIAGFVEDKFQAIQDSVDEIFNRQLKANDIQGRLAALGGNRIDSLTKQGGVLNDRGNILRAQRAAEYDVLNQATTPEDRKKTLDIIAELNAQIAENTDATRQNTDDLKQAHIDAEDNLSNFRTGIGTGLQGAIQSLATVTQHFDLPGFLKVLLGQRANLKAYGDTKRGELSDEFGINISGDAQTAIGQLSGLDIQGIEASFTGPDADAKRKRFEDLITAIIGNTTATLDNTDEINKANGLANIQDWSSSSWNTFRDALFTGASQILNTNIPGAATGASVMAGGLLRVHKGESVIPAKIVQNGFEGAGTRIEINVDNRGEGDVDTASLSRRIGWELANR